MCVHQCLYLSWPTSTPFAFTEDRSSGSAESHGCVVSFLPSCQLCSYGMACTMMMSYKPLFCVAMRSSKIWDQVLPCVIGRSLWLANVPDIPTQRPACPARPTSPHFDVAGPLLVRRFTSSHQKKHSMVARALPGGPLLWQRRMLSCILRSAIAVRCVDVLNRRKCIDSIRTIPVHCIPIVVRAVAQGQTSIGPITSLLNTVTGID